MYKPDFPYLGNQAIISSGRVMHHAKDDMVFIFGKKGVGISTPATFNVDATERTIIASPKIELGYQAETKGEPVLLGRSTITQLGRLLDAMQELSLALTKITWVPNDLAANVSLIQTTSKVLAGEITSIKAQLNSTTCISQTTYTK
jgi:hypothetical protein